MTTPANARRMGTRGGEVVFNRTGTGLGGKMSERGRAGGKRVDGSDYGADCGGVGGALGRRFVVGVAGVGCRMRDGVGVCGVAFAVSGGGDCGGGLVGGVAGFGAGVGSGGAAGFGGRDGAAVGGRFGGCCLVELVRRMAGGVFAGDVAGAGSGGLVGFFHIGPRHFARGAGGACCGCERVGRGGDGGTFAADVSGHA